ncbi:ComEC/Rec2 family competence protein [Methyloceanibacter sp. wino2]|uniref:ComEC/Rec2 family competence protein n=1 Tax=Methyloceanibacter sp. wino2 TaxID=2170729 RepID=UPI000D3E2E34|nr:ComEC/Rec2 family competence protein [Methyloceanibacter sp. wino2]
MPETSYSEGGDGDGWPPGAYKRPQGLLLRLARTLTDALEAESDRWILWLPVFFAGGIALYFALPTEPQARLAVAFILGTLGILLFVRGSHDGIALAVALLALSLGFGTAKLRTELVRAPVLQDELRHVSVEGYVEAFERRSDARDRLTLRVLSIGSLIPAETPKRVRVSIAGKNTTVFPGEAISLRATLNPPPEPVAPGDFDFGRRAWFQQLGGIGYATGRVSHLDGAPTPPTGVRLWAGIDRLRNAVGARVRAALPGEDGAIAVALITGERGGIPKRVTEAMRDAGLAHVLAISGLHMVIMAGSVFWLVRALLASVPALALRYPIKKWAAAAALLAATFYLVLSGAAVPTVRAYLMMGVVMIAILLDRPAITMRNVAIAALAILAFAPESLFDPSFQMSFAAVIGLVAAYEALSARERTSAAETSALWRRLRWTGALVLGAGLTTLIAGTAVAPFAVYHFHRMTHFGIAANMIVAPLISLLIMPMALLSLIAMPFGLEAWPLQVMGYGIELMVGAAAWVASWPGAVTILPDLSGWSLALIAFGGLWLCLWRTRLRALGLVIAALGLALAPPGNRPDVLIERDGRTAAIRGADGLIFPSATAASYSVEKWLLADGDGTDPKGLPQTTPFRCDPLGCVGKVKGKTVALIRETGAIAEDCRKADIVVAPFKLGRACKAPRIIVDRAALSTQGAHALYIEGLSIRTETVAEHRGTRPWSAHAVTPATDQREASDPQTNPEGQGTQ